MPQLRHFTAIERVSNVLFVVIHLAALLVFVVPISFKFALMGLGGYGLRMWAVSAGYHRYFAHRAYKTSRVFQLALALLGATTMQNGPIWWASVHRRHHKHSDDWGDPHSPVTRGFWYAHIGWVFDRSVPPPRDESNVRDLMRYPELLWVDRHDWLPLAAYALVCFLVGGIPGLFWGFVVSTLAIFHATMLINSLAHTWGSRRYATQDGSRNNVLLAVLTLGDGWHNNHHHYMGSARHGFRWWEIDVTYYVLRILARLGVVWALREPPSPALREASSTAI
ncbi:MAG TPA: acyl-CoA desaturase [Polyangiaceae bacterium]|jgi:stearoyl-CoA desaturase (delta-9 desaturase)|nr:acyl-CoA desaturase [Polyangiaceae bacterium]